MFWLNAIKGLRTQILARLYHVYGRENHLLKIAIFFNVKRIVFLDIVNSTFDELKPMEIDASILH